MIIEQCMRENLPLPNKIANAPSLQLGLQLYWQAFMDLDSCRPLGMGVGPIPWTAIRDYAMAFEFDEEQTNALFLHVRSMDNAYMKWNQDRSHTGKKGAKGNG